MSVSSSPGFQFPQGTYVDETESSGFGTNQAATPVKALSGQDALPNVPLSLVSTKEITNLTAANTNVTSRNVDSGTNVFAELHHEGAAEFADFVVGFSLGVEVGTTLTTTHVQARQCVLEDLLETEEFEDGHVHGGVESETALVRAEGGVELDTIAPIDFQLHFPLPVSPHLRYSQSIWASYLSLVIFPSHTELDCAFGNGCHFEGPAIFRVLLKQGRVLERESQLCRIPIA